MNATEVTHVYILFCENKVYKDILGAYGTHEAALEALKHYKKILNNSGACLLEFYIARTSFNDKIETSN